MELYGESYEETREFLKKCGMDEDPYPEQVFGLGGFPLWKVTSWEEFCNAVKKCTVPSLGSILFKGTGEVVAEIYDDFIWENPKYRWTSKHGVEYKFLPLTTVRYICYVDKHGDIVQPCANCSLVDPTPDICLDCTNEVDVITVKDEDLEELDERE